MCYTIEVSVSRSDGIGRRTGLKIQRWQHRAGSSPAFGTRQFQMVSIDLETAYLSHSQFPLMRMAFIYARIISKGCTLVAHFLYSNSFIIDSFCQLDRFYMIPSNILTADFLGSSKTVT